VEGQQLLPRCLHLSCCGNSVGPLELGVRHLSCGDSLRVLPDAHGTGNPLQALLLPLREGVNLLRLGVVGMEVGERFLVRTDHLPPSLGTVQADKQLPVPCNKFPPTIKA